MAGLAAVAPRSTSLDEQALTLTERLGKVPTEFLTTYVRGERIVKTVFSFSPSIEGIDRRDWLVKHVQGAREDLERELSFSLEANRAGLTPKLGYYSCHPNPIANHDLILIEERMESSLFDVLEKRDYALSDMLAIMCRCAHLISQFHERLGFAHNDVKPDNFVIKKGEVRLIDFGGTSVPGYGTSPYHDLHCFEHSDTQTEADRMAKDVWGLGIMLFEFSAGELFYSEDSPEHVHATLRDRAFFCRKFNRKFMENFRCPSEIVEQIKLVALAALRETPSERISPAEMTERLSSIYYSLIPVPRGVVEEKEEPDSPQVICLEKTARFYPSKHKAREKE